MVTCEYDLILCGNIPFEHVGHKFWSLRGIPYDCIGLLVYGFANKAAGLDTRFMRKCGNS